MTNLEQYKQDLTDQGKTWTEVRGIFEGDGRTYIKTEGFYRGFNDAGGNQGTWGESEFEDAVKSGKIVVRTSDLESLTAILESAGLACTSYSDDELTLDERPIRFTFKDGRLSGVEYRRS